MSAKLSVTLSAKIRLIIIASEIFDYLLQMFGQSATDTNTAIVTSISSYYNRLEYKDREAVSLKTWRMIKVMVHHYN